MDNTAWHENPASSSDFFIRADLSDHGLPGRYEQLWVTKVGERQFQICCIPFFTYGIALGDIVETDNDFTLQCVKARNGHKTIRIAVSIKEEQSRLHQVLCDWARGTGLLYEWYSEGYLAVDIPPEFHFHTHVDSLLQLCTEREISIEVDE